MSPGALVTQSDQTAVESESRSSHLSVGTFFRWQLALVLYFNCNLRNETLKIIPFRAARSARYGSHQHDTDRIPLQETNASHGVTTIRTENKGFIQSPPLPLLELTILVNHDLQWQPMG